jgi:hypothetical protein
MLKSKARNFSPAFDLKDALKGQVYPLINDAIVLLMSLISGG